MKNKNHACLHRFFFFKSIISKSITKEPVITPVASIDKINKIFNGLPSSNYLEIMDFLHQRSDLQYVTTINQILTKKLNQREIDEFKKIFFSLKKIVKRENFSSKTENKAQGIDEIITINKPNWIQAINYRITSPMNQKLFSIKEVEEPETDEINENFSLKK